jgi:hypothetical protein
MPIKFRCAYCNQLLGIARRKAGTVVRCPNCAGQVVVPKLDSAEASKGDAESDDPEPKPVPAPVSPVKGADQPARAPDNTSEPSPQRAAAGQVFEQSDFDNLLRPVPTERSPAPFRPNPPAAAVKEPEINVERVPDPVGGILGPDAAMAPMPGIWLSPAKATLLSVLAVLALTLAFVIGLMVGLYFRPALKDARRTPRAPLDVPPVRMV